MTEIEKFTERTFQERTDVSVLRKLIQCYDQFNAKLPIHRQLNDEFYDPLIIMKKMLKNCHKTGINNVTYSFSKNHIKSCFGRLISKNAGLQGIKREIRHMISHLYYDDVDIVNAHPSFLYQYCIKNGLSCDNLKKYVDNRDIILNDWYEHNNDFNKDLAKEFINSIMNGKKIEDIEMDEIYPSNIQKLYYEFQTIIKNVSDLNKDIYNIIKRRKTYNGFGSVTNTILCNIECTCLYYIVEFLEKNKYNVDGLQYDGCIVRKDLNLPLFDDILIKAAEYVLEKTGFTINLKIKPMIPIMDFNDLTPENADVVLYAEDKKNWELEHFKIIYPPMYINLLTDNEVLEQNLKDFKGSHSHFKTNIEKFTKDDVTIERVC